MKRFKLDEFTYEAQVKVLATQDELDASGSQHKVQYLRQLNLSLKEDNDFFPLVKTVVFVVEENEDGNKFYVFSHAELPEIQER